MAEKPIDTAQYFDGHLTVALGVLDAPMVIARSESTGTELELSPWIRVDRHEYASGQDKFHRDRNFAIDIVHKDFLSTYLEQHLMPFANVYAERILRHGEELAVSEALVPGLSNLLVQNDWDAIESRMTVRTTSDTST